MTARLDNLSRSLPALWLYHLSPVWKSLCSHSYPCSCTVFILYKESKRGSLAFLRPPSRFPSPSYFHLFTFPFTCTPSRPCHCSALWVSVPITSFLGFWGHRRSEHVQRWREEPETALMCGKREQPEEGDPGCAGLTIKRSLN